MGAVAELPTASSWFLNPYFMATFGIICALGLVIFGITYFAFYIKQRKALVVPDDRCGACGLTGEMIARMVPCKDHSGLVADVIGIKAWIKTHEEDYREMRRDITRLMGRNK